jgi:sec-independent protein translocase protein TatC
LPDKKIGEKLPPKTSTKKSNKASKTSDKKDASRGRKTQKKAIDKKKPVPKRTPPKTASTDVQIEKRERSQLEKTKKDLEKAKSKESELVQESDDIDPNALERGDTPMSLVGHLDEFRSRLLVSMVTIIVIALASFIFSEEILNIIERPYISTGFKLNVFNITEGFLLRLKASLIAGILLGFPVVIYEIWRYIVPAINKNDRKFARLSIIAAVILFFGGVLFTYFLILPFAIKMLLSFTPDGMENTQNASNYLSFVLLFSIGIGLIFELPIIIMILTRIGLLTPNLLIRKRKYAIVLIFIVAAIITPPDVLTQLIVGIPLVILYEISILISKLVIIRKKKQELRDTP